MSIWHTVKTKARELLGRAEYVYGKSHGDSAATVAGEANIMEADAEEEAERRAHDDPARRRDDDGLAGAR